MKGEEHKLKENEMTEDTPKTLLEKIFKKIKDPVLPCANCLCHYCTCNVEAPRGRVSEEEARAATPCFDCDECKWFAEESMHPSRRKEDCDSFILSDYEAKRNRSKLR